MDFPEGLQSDVSSTDLTWPAHLFLCGGGDRLRELTLREGEEEEESDPERDRERERDGESDPEKEREGDEDRDGDTDGLVGRALPSFAMGTVGVGGNPREKG